MPDQSNNNSVPAPPNSLAELIANRRSSLGLSISELARLASIPAAVLQELESGIRPPSPAELAALAKALNMSLVEFFNRNDTSAPSPAETDLLYGALDADGKRSLMVETKGLLKAFERIKSPDDRRRVLEAARKAAESPEKEE